MEGCLLDLVFDDSKRVAQDEVLGTQAHAEGYLRNETGARVHGRQGASDTSVC